MTFPYFIYTSTARIDAHSAQERSLRETSVRNNARDFLTGFLYREKDRFVQFVEGPALFLMGLENRLRCDPRHSDMKVLRRGTLQERAFPDWQMAFFDTSQFALSPFLNIENRKSRLSDLEVDHLIRMMIANSDHARYRQNLRSA
ncbi:MAG: BLUF domain-containing protein [Pseudomonadota bacterium]